MADVPNIQRDWKQLEEKLAQMDADIRLLPLALVRVRTPAGTEAKTSRGVVLHIHPETYHLTISFGGEGITYHVRDVVEVLQLRDTLGVEGDAPPIEPEPGGEVVP